MFCRAYYRQQFVTYSWKWYNCTNFKHLINWFTVQKTSWWQTGRTEHKSENGVGGGWDGMGPNILPWIKRLEWVPNQSTCQSLIIFELWGRWEMRMKMCREEMERISSYSERCRHLLRSQGPEDSYALSPSSRSNPFLPIPLTSPHLPYQRVSSL